MLRHDGAAPPPDGLAPGIGPLSAFGKDAMGCNLAAPGPGDNVGVARSP